MIIFFLCIFIVLGLILYSFIIEPRRLKERHYLIRKDQKPVLDISKALDLYQNDQNIVIAHISDFHFSRWFKPRRMNRLIRSVITNQPDLIVFTGDLMDDYQKWPRHLTRRLVERLKKLPAPMGKLAVMGNHDYKHDGQYFVKEALESANFTLLENEAVYGADENRSLNVVGIDTQAKNVQYHYNRTLAQWHLLLIHQPDSIRHIDNLSDYDLILAGHSHGGQIRLPFYRIKHKGALKFTNGLYLLTQKTVLSISNGLGTTRIHARFCVPPEIIYYHLENQPSPEGPVKVATLKVIS